MKAGRTRRALAAAVVSLSLLSTACGGSALTERHLGENAAPPVSIPMTFNQYAIWTAKADGSVHPVGMESGDVVYMAPSESDSYAIGAINGANGATKWSGQPQKLPDTFAGGTVSIHLTHEGLRPFIAVVATLPGEASVRVDVYQPDSSGEAVAPLSVRTFVGEKTPPKVTVTNAGVAVSGVRGSEQFVYVPSTDVVRRFQPTLNRRVGGESVPESLWAVYGQATITTWSNGGYTYRSSGGGWISEDTTPRGATKGTGRLLAADGGFVISSWRGEFVDQEIVALQDLLTGRVVSTVRVSDQPEGHEPDQEALVYAPDGKWVAWKSYAFDVNGGLGYTLPNGFVPQSINQGVAYGTQVNTPAALDVATGRAVSDAPVVAVPVSWAGTTGVFLTGTQTPVTTFGATRKNIA